MLYLFFFKLKDHKLSFFANIFPPKPDQSKLLYGIYDRSNGTKKSFGIPQRFYFTMSAHCSSPLTSDVVSGRNICIWEKEFGLWDSQKVITLKESQTSYLLVRIFSDNLSLAETLDQIYFIPFWQEKKPVKEKECGCYLPIYFCYQSFNYFLLFINV